MTAPAINIPQEMLQGIVAKAILEGVGTDTRDLLIQQALTYLVAPTKMSGDYSSRNTGPSPIQQAFEIAAGQVVHQMARELVAENQEFQQAVRTMLTEAITQVVTDPESENYNSVLDKLRKSVAEVLLYSSVRD